MMDDVAGLVMVQIISNLEGAGSVSSFSFVTVIRPIFFVIGFAVDIVLICGFAVAPAVQKMQTRS